MNKKEKSGEKDEKKKIEDTILYQPISKPKTKKDKGKKA